MRLHSEKFEKATGLKARHIGCHKTLLPGGEGGGAWPGAACLPHQIDLITKVFAAAEKYAKLLRVTANIHFSSWIFICTQVLRTNLCTFAHTHIQTKCTKEVARRESRPLTAKVAPATSFSIVFYALYLTACSVFQFRLDLIRLVVVCLFDCGAIK